MKSYRKLLAVIGGLLLCSIGLADGSRQRAEVIVPETHQSIYDAWGFAAAIVVDEIVYVSGVVVALRGEGTYEERYANGFRAALAEIDHVLEEAGSSLDDVVDITTFHTDLARQIGAAVQVRMEVMNAPHPAWTAVGTTALAVPEGVTEIKVIAHLSN